MEWDLHSSPIGYPFHPAFQKLKPSLTKEIQKQDLVFPGGLLESHVYIDAILGSYEESLMNSKQGTRQQDLNQHYLGGPLLIKMWTGLTIFIITSRDLSTASGMQ
jgi:hypothetical protein